MGNTKKQVHERLIFTKKQYQPLPGMRTQKIKGGKPMLYLGALFLVKVLDEGMYKTDETLRHKI